MRILHTEASTGMGGQELRILQESIGMRKRGHEIFFAVQRGGALATKARKEGFVVYEMPFTKGSALKTVFMLIRLIHKHKIDIINTHSSLDAWIGGFAGKLAGIRIVRTRHLSTPIRKGINSQLLYNFLSHTTVTTCKETEQMILAQAKLPPHRVKSIPTGIDPESLKQHDVEKFRSHLGIEPEDCLCGTVCVLRGWKGIYDLLHAAKLLAYVPHLKWIVVGGGVSEEYFKNIWRQLQLEKKVIFTGHLENPTTALAAMDIFLLLSWANEGVSQSSLQASLLKKPLITTPIGGLPEVCIEGLSGLHVKPHSPHEVADAVMKLYSDPSLRHQMGEAAHTHVQAHFTYEKMLNEMEKMEESLLESKSAG